MLLEYGEPGVLKELDLTFSYVDIIPDELFKNIAPYFANVHTLKFYQDDITASWTFKKLMNDAIDMHKLRTVHAHSINCIGTWLSAKSLINIQTIHLRFQCYDGPLQNRVDLNNEASLINFILNKPASLIKFTCTGLPFICMDVINRLCNDAASNINSKSNVVPLVQIDDYTNWKHLNALTPLKEVNLQSKTADFSDSGKVFSILAEQNTVEKMELIFSMDMESQGKTAIANK